MRAQASPEPPARQVAPGEHTGFKDALLADIRKNIAMAYNTLVTQAQRIVWARDRLR